MSDKEFVIISDVHDDGSITGRIWFVSPEVLAIIKNILGKPDIESLHATENVRKAMQIPWVSIKNE